MSLHKGSGFLTAVGLVAAMAPGCSSSGGGSPGDAGPDSVFVIPTHKFDAAATDDGGGGAGGFDGTTGMACKTNTDCRPDGGIGVNVCSNDPKFFTIGPVFPTPVCILPTCDPGKDGFVHYCDGPVDSTGVIVPTAPGVCLSTGTSGICLPQCTILPDGSAPKGCLGKDVCNLAGSGFDTTANQPTAVGFCQGGCKVDGDCPSSSHCQVSEGICVTTIRNPTKQLGQACTMTDSRNRVCNCLLTSNSPTAGYCTQFCTVGGVACPAGYVCDAQEPSMVSDSSGAMVPGFTQQNTGLAGTCTAVCRLDADAGPAPDAGAPASDAGGGDAAVAAPADAGALGACPPNSTCGSTSPVGPDCVP
jgi:hypothetical protein